MIPESVISEIQDKMNIVDVITPFTPLRRAGRNFKGLCVFHEEKSPSFVVSPDKQIFHCFGCGVSGNVFGFLMKYKKMDFREAVKELAEACGVAVPDDDRGGKKIVAPELYEINKAAALFYSSQLEKAPVGSPVRMYVEKRGLGRDALLKFGIGYSPDGWDHLLTYLSKEYPLELIEKAGLALPKQQGSGHYDRFRNRMMFPIVDAKGRHLGFGARGLEADAIPKYLNSPETEIYQKGKNLYGLYMALDAIRKHDSVVIVEGYMDVIACSLAGIENVAAASGTAFTSDQVRLLKRFTKNVTVLFDADKAGEMATLRGLDLLVQEECDVRVGSMPPGDDPDTYIRTHGKEKFATDVIGAAKTIFDYKFDLLSTRFAAKSVEDKVKIAMEMLETLRKIPNEVLKAGLVKRLSDELRLPESALLAEMSKKGSGVSAMMSAPKAAQATARHAVERGEVPMVERLLIGLFLTSPGFVARAKAALSPSDFSHERARFLVDDMFRVENATELKLDKFLNRIHGDPEASRLVIRSHEEVENGDHEKTFTDCLTTFVKKRLDLRKSDLSREIKAAELVGDRERVKTLMAEYSDLSRKKSPGETVKS